MKLKKKMLTFMTFSMFNNFAISSFATSNNIQSIPSDIQSSLTEQLSEENTPETDNEYVLDLDNINIPIKNFGCSEKINEILSKIEYCLTEYKKDKNLIYLNKAIELFGNIATISTIDDLTSFEYQGPVYNIFEDIRTEIYDIESEAICSNYLVELGKEILFGWRKNKISLVFPDFFLVEGLVDYNLYTENPCVLAQNKLNQLSSVYSYLVNINEENTDSEDMPDLPITPDMDYVPLPPMDFEDDKIESPEEDVDNDNATNEVPKEDLYTYSTEYKRRGASCILVETKYKNGISFEQTEKAVPKSDYVYCGINDYIFDGVNKGNNNGNYIIDDEYINNEQNEESNMYIFYTVSKNSIIPYYYNTGIRATSEGSVSYNQLKDVLYQVALKSNGFSTDTNNKSLSVIDGVPIVLYSNKDVYSKNEVESLLDSFKKVGLKIKEDDEQSQSDLEKLISNNEIISIKYNDNEVQIDGLKMHNLSVIAPIQSTTMLLGYDVKINDTNLIISKDDFKLKIMLDKDKYVLNNEEFVLDHNVINYGREFYMDISYLFEILGYKITWNSDDLCFEAKSK